MKATDDVYSNGSQQNHANSCRLEASASARPRLYMHVQSQGANRLKYARLAPFFGSAKDLADRRFIITEVEIHGT
jgi:hypothetical protein